MSFLKKIGKVLFGAAKSKKVPKPKIKTLKKKTAKQSKKKAPKSSKKKVSKASKKATKKVPKKVKGKSVKKKIKPSKRTGMVKEALAALPVAEVTHYFPHVDAAVLKIKDGDIRVGDKLHFKGHTTNFTQKIVSMQIDHQPVLIAKKGDDFGVQVKARVRAGDVVTKIS